MIKRNFIAVLIFLALVVPFLIVLLIANEQGDINKAFDFNYLLTFYLLIYAAAAVIVGGTTGLYYLVIEIKNKNASNRNY